MESGWVRAAKLGDIPPKNGLAVRLGDREIALFRLGAEVFAVEDRCPHQNSELHTGTLSPQGLLTCAWHGWRFDLVRCVEGMPSPRVFPVRVEGEEVLVDLGSGRDPRVGGNAATA